MNSEPIFPLVDAAEVARHFGVSKRTVYRLARRRELPCRRVGNSIRFDLTELKRLSVGPERRVWSGATW